MAKICPITNGPVLYLTCLECEDKVCETADLPSVPLEQENNTTDDSLVQKNTNT